MVICQVNQNAWSFTCNVRFIRAGGLTYLNSTTLTSYIFRMIDLLNDASSKKGKDCNLNLKNKNKNLRNEYNLIHHDIANWHAAPLQLLNICITRPGYSSSAVTPKEVLTSKPASVSSSRYPVKNYFQERKTVPQGKYFVGTTALVKTSWDSYEN